MYSCIPSNYNGNKSHYSTQWSVASFIQDVFHLRRLWLKCSNCDKHNCWIVPRNQVTFRGRKENGFQLILVDASSKKREILQSSLLPDHVAPAGATLHITKHTMGSVITTSLIHQCYAKALPSNAISAPNCCHKWFKTAYGCVYPQIK